MKFLIAIAIAALALCASANSAIHLTAPTPMTSTITVTVTGPGFVVSEPSGINCPGWTTCSASFPSGDLITLDAYPADGYQLWYWGRTNCPEYSTTCKVSAFGDKTVTAFFAEHAQP